MIPSVQNFEFYIYVQDFDKKRRVFESCLLSGSEVKLLVFALRSEVERVKKVAANLLKIAKKKLNINFSIFETSTLIKFWSK